MTKAKRLTGAFVGLSFVLGGLLGCVADPGSAGGDDDMPLGTTCTGHLLVSGTFELGAPQPSDVFGCWPVGTWTLTATVESHNCPSAPVLESQYQFKVERDVDNVEHYTYLNDPAYEKIRLKVTSGGGGLCEGGFEIYSEDGTTITNLKPNLNADMSINGQGDYDVYPENQW
jgi:hypothetical protein